MSHQKQTWSGSLAIVGVLAFGALPMEAAPARRSMPGSSISSGSKSTGHDWFFSIPIVAERNQLKVHGEYNVQHAFGLALELASLTTEEELATNEVQKTGNSMKINGVQAALLFSRYSDEANMGGFYWSLGAGYRRWNADWKKQAEQKDVARLSLADTNGYLHHRVEGEGVTGHARVGYRYVANEWPFGIGAYFGLRHMNQETIKDVQVRDQDRKKLDLQYSKISKDEKRDLKNKMMTEPELGLEIGLAF